jgi:hypothetical protein
MATDAQDDDWVGQRPWSKINLFLSNFVYSTAFQPDFHPFQNEINELMTEKLLFTYNYRISNVRDDQIFYKKELFKMTKPQIQAYLLPHFQTRYMNVIKYSLGDNFQLFDE